MNLEKIAKSLEAREHKELSPLHLALAAAVVILLVLLVAKLLKKSSLQPDFLIQSLKKLPQERLSPLLLTILVPTILKLLSNHHSLSTLLTPSLETVVSKSLHSIIQQDDSDLKSLSQFLSMLQL